MEPVRITQEARLERLQTRSKTARKWWRLGLVGLVGLCFSAIWQERALAPVVHDKMQVGFELAWELIEADGASSYLTAMSGFSGNGSSSDYNAITTWLLNNRN